jgi:molecular chaperone DnaK
MEKMNMFGANSEVAVAKERNSAAFGIDLGTTNSCISVIPSGSTPVIIDLEGGKKTLPSCVMWKGKKGEFVVGQEAYKNRYRPSTIYSVKRLMGSGKTVTLKYGTKELIMTPAEVSAEILKELVRQASTEYKNIRDVTITVPAYFNNKQIEDTLEAGNLAGLNVLGILREPTSASLVYDTQGAEEKVLVYDLGGGTFDVSLVRISTSSGLGDLSDIYGIKEKGESVSAKLYSVLDTDGDSNLGGDDIDRELYKIIEKKIAAMGHDIEHISETDKEGVILRIEQSKKRGPGSYGIPLDFKLKNKAGRIKTMVSIDYYDFIEATKVIYRKTKAKVDSVIGRTDVSTISSIALVGGSTKSPIIRELLAKDFPGVELNYAMNPDEAVALGAAIKAKEVKFGDKSVEVFDILPMAIGVLSDGYVRPIIKKNQRVPFTDSQTFATAYDDQEVVEVHVFQGISPIKDECLYLGTVMVKGLPKKPAEEVAVVVKLGVDTNGVLKCQVISGDVVEEAELVNLFGSKEERKVLSVDERRAAKWRQFASTLGAEGRKEVLEVVDRFVKGEAKVTDVSAVISRHSNTDAEIVKPRVNLIETSEDEQ